MILAGDIGGTKTRLARVRLESGRVALTHERSFPSGAYPDLAHILDEYLAGQPDRVEAACFGVAGPVAGGESRVTNLPWWLREADLVRDLGARRVVLINDLVANAHGLGELPASAFATLQKGRPDPHGPRALVSAGTGLGMAILGREGGRTIVLASEGGHADFAPRNELEDALAATLRAEQGRAEIEHVLSGAGLVRLYRFLLATGRASGPAPAELDEEDDAAAITRAALDRGLPAARRCLEAFAAIYGAVAGNLALTVLPTGGLYLGGGIPPRILPALCDGAFLAAFLSKGAFRELLEKVPVRVVVDDRAALLGAGRKAMEASDKKEP